MNLDAARYSFPNMPPAAQLEVLDAKLHARGFLPPGLRALRQHLRQDLLDREAAYAAHAARMAQLIHDDPTGQDLDDYLGDDA